MWLRLSSEEASRSWLKGDKAMKYKVNFFLNEEPMELYVDANRTMLNVLRDELCYTGTK